LDVVCPLLRTRRAPTTSALEKAERSPIRCLPTPWPVASADCREVQSAPMLPAGYVVSASRIADRRMILAGYRLAASLKQMITPPGSGCKRGTGGTFLDHGTKALIVGPAWVGGHMQFKRVARVPLERCVEGWVEFRRRPAVPDPFTLATTRRDGCQDANSL